MYRYEIFSNLVTKLRKVNNKIKLFFFFCLGFDFIIIFFKKKKKKEEGILRRHVVFVTYRCHLTNWPTMSREDKKKPSVQRWVG